MFWGRWAPRSSSVVKRRCSSSNPSSLTGVHHSHVIQHPIKWLFLGQSADWLLMPFSPLEGQTHRPPCSLEGLSPPGSPFTSVQVTGLQSPRAHADIQTHGKCKLFSGHGICSDNGCMLPCHIWLTIQQFMVPELLTLPWLFPREFASEQCDDQIQNKDPAASLLGIDFCLCHFQLLCSKEFFTTSS